MPFDLDRMGVVYAPWTDAEVDILNTWQETVFIAPFSCIRLHRRNPRLVAENDGWHCPRCDHIQIWAHDFQLAKADLVRHPVIIQQRSAGIES